MVKAMDCGIVVSEFVLQLRYYVHFLANTRGKGMDPFILPVMGQIAPQPFFYDNGFGIKYPTEVDMPLNKETKPNLDFNINDSKSLILNNNNLKTCMEYG